MIVALSAFFALLAAGSNALGTVLQRRAVLSIPASPSLRPGLLRDLARTPSWLCGMLAVVAAALLQGLALATGALSVVQPVFVLELPLALVIGGAVFHVHQSRAAWISVAGIASGLAVFLFSLAPGGGRQQVPGLLWVPVLAVTGALGVVLTLTGLRRPAGMTRAASLGAAAAIGNALTAALIKSAADVFASEGVDGFLRAWQTYSFGVVGAGALLLLETAMQAGPLIASQPALTLGDAAASFCLGIVLYTEQPRTGWWLLPAFLGFGVLCGSTLALALTKCLEDCVPPVRPDTT